MVKFVVPFAFVASVVAVDPFNWKPCAAPEDKDPSLQCGFLAVPLNHLNKANNQTIDIAVRRYRSSSPTRQGTILLNPGGPGVPATGFASRGIMMLLGGDHDVLAFDPRGVGQSRPPKCSKNGFTSVQEDAAAKIMRDIPYDTPTSETSLGRYGSWSELRVRRCEKYDGEYLKYISTAFVARDMDLIRAALGESLTNYYGLSYGTALGATYVNMFPTRVGRVAIDSVLDPTIYTAPTSGMNEVNSADLEQVFEGFCTRCEAAGPQFCPLADAKASNRGYVCAKLRALFAKIDANPLVLPAGDDLGILSGSGLRQQVFESLYRPSAWPQLAGFLASLLAGKATVPPTAAADCPAPSNYRGSAMEWHVFVGNDGDNTNADWPNDWDASFANCKKVSPTFGAVLAKGPIHCKYWTTKPIERYAGPWDKQLKNPIVILNNELDPITPLRSANNLAGIMGDNAIVATRDGYGHATINLPSRCIQQLLANFFKNGIYPESYTNCAVDMDPFIPPTPPPHARSADEGDANDLEAARQEVAKFLDTIPI
ncbi:Aste57867_1605 [Aphanomyces stellatus]|uniref:Aste57867_1605 protein n=1 Tax=Aphanomyces stellatus TaxID=120398 RepID=A0A485K929_9STRA|nr:hypothetical protein As57867_001604 [Aphanomyces stellatus]VFT78818.1 Aste57867_1605 [Aphanomyces stellatus]